MALRFSMSGGNFIFSQGASAPGIWLSSGNFVVTASAPLPLVGDGFAFESGGANATAMRCPDLGGNFSGLIAGCRMWIPVSNFVNNTQLIIFHDSSGNAQCDVRMNAAGQLFFTRNGTVIGGTSSFAISPSVWFYLEFKALFSTSGAGTCEVRVNSTVVRSDTSLTNATTTAAAALCDFAAASGGTYMRDFYCLDTGSGANTSYLGDADIVELFPNGPGVHSAWAANVGPFTVTAVAGSGSSWTFTGSWTTGGSNAYVGYNFNTSSCGSGNNQTGVQCTASAAGSITLSFSGGSAQTGLTGTLAFQAIVQAGINADGTRPNGDLTYISDSTTGDISDFAHEPLTLTGVILAVVHQSYLRKDDLGARQVAQVCLSGSATEVGATISLGNTYEYFQDILEVDPNTSTQFSVSGLNSATLGIKEIS